MTVREVLLLAMANYDRGGDYIVTMLSDEDIRRMFCGRKDGKDGKKAVYDYMRKAEEMRRECRRMARGKC